MTTSHPVGPNAGADVDTGTSVARSTAALASAAEPSTPVSRSWLWLFALIWFGFWLLVMLPGQFMLAKISAQVAPADKVQVTSFLIGEAALVILVSVPVIGVLSDRTRNRFGRRRTWALGGFITAAVPFALVGLQTSWPVIAVLVAVISLGQAAILVALSAMIADQVPRLQRGRASAAMGVPQVIALAGGMVLVTMLVTSVPGSWAVVAVLAVLSCLPRPRHYPGYYWAMTSRVLIHAGVHEDRGRASADRNLRCRPALHRDEPRRGQLAGADRDLRPARTVLQLRRVHEALHARLRRARGTPLWSIRCRSARGCL